MSILENEIHAVLLDSGRDKWKLFENEEINESEDMLIGEGSVQDFKGQSFDSTTPKLVYKLFSDLKKPPYKRKFIHK